MTGLEIENWIEKRGRTVRKFRSTRPRTESNFRFGLTSCRSQNLPTEVRSLLCQVFDSFFSRNLVMFTPCLTPPRIYPKSNKAILKLHSTGLTMNFFSSAGDFRQVHNYGHHQWMNGQEVLAMRSPVIEDLAEGVPRTCTVWQRTLLWDTRTAIFSSKTPEQQRWALGLKRFEPGIDSRIDKNSYRFHFRLIDLSIQKKKIQSATLAREYAGYGAGGGWVACNLLPRYAVYFRTALQLPISNVDMDSEGSAQAFVRKSRSGVWEHFTRRKDAARCNLCGKEYKFFNSTSNLSKHLRTSHSDVWKDAGPDKASTKPITSWVISKGNTHSCSSSKAKAITELIVDWLSTSGRPLSIVNDPGFSFGSPFLMHTGHVRPRGARFFSCRNYC